MSPATNLRALIEQVAALALSAEQTAQRQSKIGEHVLQRSRYIRTPDFEAIHDADLELLFRAYDERYFDGLCRSALDGRSLRFRLSPRLTKSGGVTKRFNTRDGRGSFEIAIGHSVLFEGFRAGDRSVTACGVECHSRLDALQRVFEHELVHLIEFLCWEKSNCSAPRFQEIAARLFLHKAHTHALITRRERAAESGIHLGSRVSFTVEGRQLTGFVNRITKRATVLVESPGGEKFSDGKRYEKYYVPLRWLRLV
jgi:hypothetical protein